MSHDVQKRIADECDAIKELLLRKNHEYGNSALEPINVFSGAAAVDQIAVRIDDKLNRLRNLRTNDITPEIVEDTVMDLIGYLVLYRIAPDYEPKRRISDVPQQLRLSEKR